MREAKDSLEARVLRVLFVGGIMGGSWVSVEVGGGGGVAGRGRVKGRGARRGEERSCSVELSMELSVSVMVEGVVLRVAGKLWLMSAFAWCIMVSVEGVVEDSEEERAVENESRVWVLAFWVSGWLVGGSDWVDELSVLADRVMTPSFSSWAAGVRGGLFLMVLEAHRSCGHSIGMWHKAGQEARKVHTCSTVEGIWLGGDRH